MDVIQSFDSSIIQSQVVLPGCNLLPSVLYACRRLGNVEFAERVWDYVTDPSRCLGTLERDLYALVLRVCQTDTKNKTARRLVNKVMDRWILDARPDDAEGIRLRARWVNDFLNYA